MPKLARDYLYQMVIPVAKRHGMYVNEYPALERIYNKEKSDSCVYLKRNSTFPFNRDFRDGFDFVLPSLLFSTSPVGGSEGGTVEGKFRFCGGMAVGIFRCVFVVSSTRIFSFIIVFC